MDVDVLDCRVSCWLKATDDQLAALTPPQLTLLIEIQVARCLAHAQRYWPAIAPPKVWCDLRGKSAGQAHLGRGGVRFNPILLAEQPRPFIESVVPHEMAHWIVFQTLIQREPPHGPTWRHIMRAVYGCVPHVTHRFDITRASPTPYRYGCQCREHRLSERRHRRVLRGGAYRCAHCRTRLSYLDCDRPA